LGNIGKVEIALFPQIMHFSLFTLDISKQVTHQ
jgi:hypothetical protein